MKANLIIFMGMLLILVNLITSGQFISLWGALTDTVAPQGPTGLPPGVNLPAGEGGADSNFGPPATGGGGGTAHITTSAVRPPI